MESGKELNEALRAEVNKRFEDLYKEIGPNRAQLSAQVLTSQREIIKGLSKEKADAKRKEEVIAEIAKIEKMASRQLPHHLRRPAPEPVAKAGTNATPKTVKPVKAKPNPEKAAKAPKAATAAKTAKAPKAAAKPLKKKK